MHAAALKHLSPDEAIDGVSTGVVLVHGTIVIAKDKKPRDEAKRQLTLHECFNKQRRRQQLSL